MRIIILFSVNKQPVYPKSPYLDVRLCKMEYHLQRFIQLEFDDLFGKNTFLGILIPDWTHLVISCRIINIVFFANVVIIIRFPSLSHFPGLFIYLISTLFKLMFLNFSFEFHTNMAFTIDCVFYSTGIFSFS